MFSFIGFILFIFLFCRDQSRFPPELPHCYTLSQRMIAQVCPDLSSPLESTNTVNTAQQTKTQKSDRYDVIINLSGGALSKQERVLM